MIKTQEKLAQITHSKLKEAFDDLSENQEKLIEKMLEEKILGQILDPQEVQNVLSNTKLINDTYSQFSDLSNTINKLQQNMKKSFAEHRTALINEVLPEATQILSFEMLNVQNLKFMSTPGQAGMILDENEKK